jgi:hypothetical protein
MTIGQTPPLKYDSVSVNGMNPEAVIIGFDDGSGNPSLSSASNPLPVSIISNGSATPLATEATLESVLAILETHGLGALGTEATLASILTTLQAQGGGVTVKDAAGALFWMVTGPQAGQPIFYVYGTNTLGTPVLPVVPFVTNIGQVSLATTDATNLANTATNTSNTAANVAAADTNNVNAITAFATQAHDDALTINASIQQLVTAVRAAESWVSTSRAGSTSLVKLLTLSKWLMQEFLSSSSKPVTATAQRTQLLRSM